MKENTFTIKQLNPILRAVELNKELCIRLRAIKTRAEENKKELEIVLNVAKQLSLFKQQLHDDFKEIDKLTKEEKAEINKLFVKRHLQGFKI